MLMLCYGVRKADEGSGFIFAGLGGGGASCCWWLHANRQTSNNVGINVCKKDFITDVLYGKVNKILLNHF